MCVAEVRALFSPFFFFFLFLCFVVVVVVVVVVSSLLFINDRQCSQCYTSAVVYYRVSVIILSGSVRKHVACMLFKRDGSSADCGVVCCRVGGFERLRQLTRFSIASSRGSTDGSRAGNVPDFEHLQEFTMTRRTWSKSTIITGG